MYHKLEIIKKLNNYRKMYEKCLSCKSNEILSLKSFETPDFKNFFDIKEYRQSRLKTYQNIQNRIENRINNLIKELKHNKMKVEQYKKTVEFLNQFNTDIDLVYVYENGVSFEEYQQRICDYINEEEIIYHSKAMEYLREYDNSLFESLSIASELCYDVEDLNSELLATLLYQQNLHIEWYEISQEIEQHFEENNY
tara:strand:+ start:127 stop:714 length:588 start_codon:yes stop_codon:yes gene_type:complete